MALPFPDIDVFIFPPVGPFEIGGMSIGPIGIRWYAMAYIAGILLGWRYANSLLRNTAQFVAGQPANNVLLTGARGTGKSSLIKACLNTFADQGLRLIEVDKADLVALQAIVAAAAVALSAAEERHQHAEQALNTRRVAIQLMLDNPSNTQALQSQRKLAEDGHELARQHQAEINKLTHQISGCERERAAVAARYQRLEKDLRQAQHDRDQAERNLRPNDDTLQAWLEREKPEWRDTIGKVLRPELLQGSGELVIGHDSADSLYGLALDLNCLDLPAGIDPADLQASLDTAEAAIEACSAALRVCEGDNQIHNERLRALNGQLVAREQALKKVKSDVAEAEETVALSLERLVAQQAECSRDLRETDEARRQSQTTLDFARQQASEQQKTATHSLNKERKQQQIQLSADFQQYKQTFEHAVKEAEAAYCTALAVLRQNRSAKLQVYQGAMEQCAALSDRIEREEKRLAAFLYLRDQQDEMDALRLKVREQEASHNSLEKALAGVAGFQEVRGQGLMLGIEMVSDKAGRTLSAAARRACKGARMPGSSSAKSASAACASISR